MVTAFFVLILLFVGFISVIVVPIVLASKAMKTALEGNGPVLQSQARVIAKRSQTYGGNNTSVREAYFATFEFPNGQRMELVTTGESYGLLVEGDTGIAYWRGRLLKDFRRIVGPQDRPRVEA